LDLAQSRVTWKRMLVKQQQAECQQSVTVRCLCACMCGRGVAGEPAQIKCSLNGSSKVRLGQKVDGDIQVNVKDRHGNEIKKVRRRPNAALNGFATHM